MRFSSRSLRPGGAKSGAEQTVTVEVGPLFDCQRGKIDRLTRHDLLGNGSLFRFNIRSRRRIRRDIRLNDFRRMDSFSIRRSRNKSRRRGGNNMR